MTFKYFAIRGSELLKTFKKISRIKIPAKTIKKLCFIISKI